jgi:hypothetical protein
MTEVETKLQRIERDIVVQKRIRRRHIAERRPVIAEDAEIETLTAQALAIRETMRRQREGEMTDAEELRAYWNKFCDADQYPDGFEDRMEAAGFAEVRPVTDDDLHQSFSAERGIDRGGMLWCLTDAGHAAFKIIADDAGEIGDAT